MTATVPLGRSAEPARTPPRSRAAALLAVLLLSLSSVLFLQAPAAHALGNGEWSIDPLVPEGADQNNRRYFFLDGAPGQTIQDTAVLANTSNRPMTFKLFGADAYNTPRDGGFGIKLINDQMTGVGLWIKIAGGQSEITLQPMQKATIPFTVTIPQNARAGDHAGAITALNTEVFRSQQDGQYRINEQMQIGARIYLRVAGQILPSLEVRDVRVERDTGFGAFFGDGKVIVRSTLVNRGNVILTPSLNTHAEGLFGRKLLDRTTKPEEKVIQLLPGEKIELVQEWNDAPRLDRVEVKVTATSQYDGAPVTGAGKTSYTAVPWPALLTFAVLLLGAGVLWSYLRNRKAQGGGSGDGAKPEPPRSPSGGAAAGPDLAKQDKGAGDPSPAADAEVSEGSADAADATGVSR